MSTENLLFIGTLHYVAAIDKSDGGILWRSQLKTGLFTGHPFVTLLVEDQKVFAHTGGELFCLDALTGRQLWMNKLEGLGYEMASLAIAGSSAPSPEAIAQLQHEEAERQRQRK